MFGSSGHITRPQGGILQNYYHCRPDHQVKTIANLHYVDQVHSPHDFTYKEPYYAVDENYQRVDGYFNHNASFQKAFIHHYVIKSVEDFAIKLARGNAWGGRRKQWIFFEKEDARTRHSFCRPLVMPEEGSRY
eukprot:scaffold3227_cov188-Ochromonas_danica.AAC.26